MMLQGYLNIPVSLPLAIPSRAHCAPHPVHIENERERKGKKHGLLYTPSRKTYVHRAHKSSNSGICLWEFNIHYAPIFILVLPMNITEQLQLIKDKKERKC